MHESTGAVFLDVPHEPPNIQKPVPSRLALRKQCIEAFFQHFYPAHPFVLPLSNYRLLRKSESIHSIEAAMRSVGSYYVPQAPTVALGLEAERSVYHPDCPKDSFLVQAMLIIAIGLDGYTYQEKALRILCDAQDLALKIGMNERAFASGAGSEVLAESWPRTWWELYVVDGLIAGAHQKSSFRMLTIPADVELPCEEKDYARGNIPPAHSFEDFDNRLFDQREFAYSSYSYRIGAIRNLGKIFHLLQKTPPDELDVNRVDVHLVNWRLNLPDSKRLIDVEVRFDEMLFQAHMITSLSTILLHRELSELDSSVTRNITSHAPYKPITPGQSYNIHAAKTIQATQDISKLIQLPVPVAQHSPFFIPIITVAAIVHLSSWSVVLMPWTQDDDMKQHLSLCTGALRSFWEVWPAAGMAYGQVKGVAQEIYAAKKRAGEAWPWANLTGEEVARSMAEDYKNYGGDTDAELEI
ncbi:hypothetical protein N431DRAFT_416090 [Stipitochalara longipes BDJ]|nr:hypothetical protein N431DRAFT_416090 [Stipitochalara longipes BDJ]